MYWYPMTTNNDEVIRCVASPLGLVCVDWGGALSQIQMMIHCQEKKRSGTSTTRGSVSNEDTWVVMRKCLTAAWRHQIKYMDGTAMPL